jgi:uncharacterized protein (TIGR03118 family)
MKTFAAKTALRTAAILAAGIASTLYAVHVVPPTEFGSTNLESNIDGVAGRNDANIDVPWGIAVGVEFHNIWVANNGGGVITGYGPEGAQLTGAGGTPIVITVPAVQVGGVGSPTGVWVVETAFDKKIPLGFPVPVTGGSSSVPAQILSVTLDGEIVGWSGLANLGGTAVVEKTVAGASYTGLALTDAIVGSATTASHLLYAANAKAGTVDVFDDNFNAVTTLAGSFTDPNPVAGYVPANIKQFRAKNPATKKIADYLLVAYAKAGAAGALFDEGAGFGYVDLFMSDGTFVSRLIDVGGPLDIPWGMVVGSEGFTVANHGDGTLLHYLFTSLAPGTAATPSPSPFENLFGQPLTISGVWGLHHDYNTFSPAAYLAAGEVDVENQNSIVFAGEPVTGEGLVGRLKKR